MTNKFTAPPKQEKEYKLPPNGNIPARCFGIVDIGSHEKVYDGETKINREVIIFFELPNETAVFKEGEEAKPFVVNRRFTYSFHKKSNLRISIESWLGKKLTEEELDSGAFSLSDMLGKECLLGISHDLSKESGKTWANIKSITPTVKGMTIPAQINPSQTFFMGWGPEYKVDESDFVEIFPWVKKIIEESPEYKASNMGKKDEFLEMLK